MHPRQLAPILEGFSTSRERLIFHYFRDRYAFLLLADFVGDGMPVRRVRRSAFGRLLSRPAVREFLQDAGDGILRDLQLLGHWPRQPEAYVLTLGAWNGPQTSRGGANLVLQLNFSNKHDRPYRNLVTDGEAHPFEVDGHPVAAGRRTLAWARVDLDEERGEALIEEVQTDWIRLARSAERDLKHLDEGWWTEEHLQRWYPGLACDGTRLQRYLEQILAPHLRMWDEAMLAATIWFLRERLGLRRIFYHTFDGGVQLKGMRWCPPPRSLYTDLPKRFCFRETEERPGFLQKRRRRRRGKWIQAPPRFFLLTA